MCFTRSLTLAGVLYSSVQSLRVLYQRPVRAHRNHGTRHRCVGHRLRPMRRGRDRTGRLSRRVASWLGNSLGRQLEAARKYAADRDLTLDASMHRCAMKA
jgi:hypothetical protein